MLGSGLERSVGDRSRFAELQEGLERHDGYAGNHSRFLKVKTAKREPSGADLEGLRAGARRLRYFKLSTDPYFVAQLRYVVGLYVAPLQWAIVFSFDEKSQIRVPGPDQAGGCRQRKGVRPSAQEVFLSDSTAIIRPMTSPLATVDP